jgi:hypothetical protein
MTGRILRRLGRIGLAFVGIALLLGTIDVTIWLNTKANDVDAAQAPFTVSADMGQEAQARTFVAAALSVRGAAVIHDSADHSTPGVWLIVKVQAAVIGKTRSIGYAAIRDSRGRVYVASDRLEDQFAGSRGVSLEPGVPEIGEIAFEVPRDAATAPTLLLAEPLLDQRADSMLEIKLNTNSSATIDGWATDPKATPLLPVTVAQ